MASLSIPEPIKVGLIQLAALTDEQFQSLYSALENIPLRINQQYIFDEAGVQVEGIPSEQFTSIRDAIFPLYRGQSNASTPESTLVDGIVESLREQKKDGQQAYSDEMIGTLKGRLSRLLNINRAKLIAKANDVLVEHARTYGRARVLSDIRPVFEDDLGNPPNAAVIVHMLKINYYEAGETNTFVVALDNKDVQQLIDVLKRAQAKTETLKSIIAASNMTTIEVA